MLDNVEYTKDHKMVSHGQVVRNCDLIRDTDSAIELWRELAVHGQIPYHRGMLTEAWTFVHWWGQPVEISTTVNASSGKVVSRKYGVNDFQNEVYVKYISKSEGKANV